jgi:hypothetical protein
MIAQYVFNETSPAAASTNAASSQPVSGTSGVAAGVASSQMMDDGAGVDIIAELVGATGGTLDVLIQIGTADGGWFDAVHFPQLAAGAAAVIYRCNLSPLPTPGLAAAPSAPTVVGSGVHAAGAGLAANVVVQGLGFDRLRLLMCSGSGTTAGAAVRVYCTVQRARVQNQ